MTMIDSAVLKVLAKRTPNYHTVSPSIIKATFSVCNCARCRHHTLDRIGGETVHGICQRVRERLEELGASGHAIVADNGTCDAAQFTPEDYSRFALEAEKLEKPVEFIDEEGGGNV